MFVWCDNLKEKLNLAEARPACDCRWSWCWTSDSCNNRTADIQTIIIQQIYRPSSSSSSTTSPDILRYVYENIHQEHFRTFEVLSHPGLHLNLRLNQTLNLSFSSDVRCLILNIWYHNLGLSPFLVWNQIQNDTSMFTHWEVC